MERDFLISAGLDAETAQALTELIEEEKAAEVETRAQQLYKERAEQLPRLLSLTPGSAQSVDGAAFSAMGYAERAKLWQHDRELYERLAGRNAEG